MSATWSIPRNPLQVPYVLLLSLFSIIGPQHLDQLVRHVMDPPDILQIFHRLVALPKPFIKCLTQSIMLCSQDTVNRYCSY